MNSFCKIFFGCMTFAGIFFKLDFRIISVYIELWSLLVYKSYKNFKNVLISVYMVIIVSSI